MDTLTHTMNLDYSIDTIWRLVRSFDHWAQSIPGYVSHYQVNPQEYNLSVKANFGITKKNLLIKFKATDIKTPSRMLFKINSENKHIQGRGYFDFSKINDEKTAIFLRVDYLVTGAMRSLAKTMISSSAKEKIEIALKDIVKNLIQVK